MKAFGAAPVRRRSTSTGSSTVVAQNTTAMTARTAAQMSATDCQPQASKTKGATNFVTAAPTLPTPKIPSAVPWRDGAEKA